jgi:hypothetical protein
MSEQTHDEHTPDGDLGEQSEAPAMAAGTDIDAADLDVSQGAGGDRPASSDPAEHVDDATLGGVGGENAGGAG